MTLAVLTDGMPPELGEVLIAIDAIALTVFFGMLYSVEISAVWRRLAKWLTPSHLVARCRQWLAAHKASH